MIELIKTETDVIQEEEQLNEEINKEQEGVSRKANVS